MGDTDTGKKSIGDTNTDTGFLVKYWRYSNTDTDTFFQIFFKFLVQLENNVTVFSQKAILANKQELANSQTSK